MNVSFFGRVEFECSKQVSQTPNSRAFHFSNDFRPVMQLVQFVTVPNSPSSIYPGWAKSTPQNVTSKYTNFASTSRLFISQASHPYSKAGLITVVYSLILYSGSVSHEIPLYGTQMLTTMFTTAHHWFLSQAR